MLDSVPDIDMLGFLPDFLDGNPSLFPSALILYFYWSLNNLSITTTAGLFNMLSNLSIPSITLLFLYELLKIVFTFMLSMLIIIP